MNGVVILLIILLSPTGEVHTSQLGKPHLTPEACAAAFEEFKVEAAEAEVPPDRLRAICFTTPWAPEGQGI